MSIALITLLPQLVAAGIATEQQIAAIVKSFHPALTDPEINVILELVKADAQKHLSLAQADQKPNA